MAQSSDAKIAIEQGMINAEGPTPNDLGSAMRTLAGDVGTQKDCLAGGLQDSRPTRNRP
jgi:hypothetical protein